MLYNIVQTLDTGGNTKVDTKAEDLIVIVGNDDAFLTLEPNCKGQPASGKEIFSNGEVALDKHGLVGMAWVDSNYDGKLDAADPVFDEQYTKIANVQRLNDWGFAWMA